MSERAGVHRRDAKERREKRPFTQQYQVIVQRVIGLFGPTHFPLRLFVSLRFSCLPGTNRNGLALKQIIEAFFSLALSRAWPCSANLKQLTCAVSA